MNEIVFSSHTKLLLSGEYLVTQGALALAIPLKFTQDLRITETGNHADELLWQSCEQGKVWFEAAFDTDDFQINATTDKQIGSTLQRILVSARQLNPDFLIGNHEIHAETETDFELKWGLGSSSTLIASVARWAHVDPYELLHKTFGGSGYDIACATAQGPIFYKLLNHQPEVSEAPFRPPFAHLLGLVYLGTKMNSQRSMDEFRKQGKFSEETIRQISQISKELTEVFSIEEFEKLLQKHEQIMADVLQNQPIKESMFMDYPFSIKSLGAWGGDFALFTCRNPKEAISYFQQKSLHPVFWLQDVIRMNS